MTTRKQLTTKQIYIVIQGNKFPRLVLIELYRIYLYILVFIFILSPQIIQSDDGWIKRGVVGNECNKWQL